MSRYVSAFEASLSAPSAYRMKKDKPDAWANLVDEIDGALFPAQLDEIQARLEFRPLDWPAGWFEDAMERMDRRREELAEEDVGQIMRSRFDF